jgi:catechol 2,3-dioxygenase-like lactoylglutathione lyase family enzyme
VALHRVAKVTIGVPDVATTAAYYDEFGLTRATDGRTAFATTHGGEQLELVHTDRRCLVEFRIAADDHDDLGRVAASLEKGGYKLERGENTVTTVEPVSGTIGVIEVLPRLQQPRQDPTPYNGIGRIERPNTRAPGIIREGAVTPRKLGHFVLGSTDYDATRAFFLDGLGFKLSDQVPGVSSFMRCSTDHHNVLVLPAPVNFMHHTSWQVDDVDDVGRGATAMLEGNPERHIWGLGRHHIGSNFFWYLKDPAGNFSEYYSDMDAIIDDQTWTAQDFEGASGLYRWGPPPPPSFLAPEDLGALMTGSHSERV